VPLIPILTAVVGAGIALGIVALLGGFGGDSNGAGSGKSTTSTTKAAPPPPLTGDALRLRHLLTAGNKVTYHATYNLTSTDPQLAGGSVAIEVWRKPPDERQDSSEIVTGSPAQHQEALYLSGELINCSQAGTLKWSCSSAGKGQTSGPDAIVRKITAQLAGYLVTSRTATYAGVPSDCFDMSNSTGKLTLCVDSEGVPDFVNQGTDTLQASEIDHNIPGGTFTPPGPVTSGTTTSSP